MAIFAGSCQQEKLEPVAGNGTVTFTVEAPANVQTKAIADGKNVNELIYEVWLTGSLGDLTQNAQKLYQDKTEMAVDQADGKNKASITLDLVNDQKFTVLFWAQVEGTGVYDTKELNAVTYTNKTAEAYYANDENLAAFYAVAYVNDCQHVKKDGTATGSEVTLRRPFAQLNLGTLNTSTAYTVELVSSKVKVTNANTVFNVATSVASAPQVMEFRMNGVPADPATLPGFDNPSYWYAGMNYLFAGDNATVEYNIVTKLNGGMEGTVNNTVSSVPLKENYRTNIIGNLLTSKVDYQIVVDANFDTPDEAVEVVTVSTAAELVEAIGTEPSAEGEETNIKLEGDINLSDLFAILTRATTEDPKSITINKGLSATIDLNGYSITGVDEGTASFGLITNRGNLTITNSSSKQSRIALVAKENREWNAYSSVISNTVGGNLLVKGNVLIEHLGGTDMAYGIDNLTNGKGTSAIATVEGATVKSTYRAIRQFLNGIEATNELYVKAGSKIYGTANKSIWMQDPSANANTGKLVVEDGAELYGDVYLSVTAGSTEWPVQVSIADSALQDDYTVLTSNVPDKYELVNSNGVWTIDTALIEEGDVITVYSANALKKIADKVNAGDTFEGKTVKLAADIDLMNDQWIPIGYWETFNGIFDGQNHTISNLKHHGTEADCYVGLFGYTNNATIKNLTINNVDIKLVADNSWAGGHMGALVGNADGTIVIENINVTGDVKIEGDLTQAGAGRIGGVVGGNTCTGTIKNVVVNANAGSFVKGNSSVGGIAGQLQPSATGGELTFENCSSNIDVTAQQFYAGGIIGLAAYGTSFTDCYTSGNISVLAGRSGNANDLYRVGGIAGGWDDGADKVLSLVNCSTTCELSGQSVDGKTATTFDCGGFVGRGYSTVVGAKVVVNGTEYIYAGDGKYADANGFVMIAPGLSQKEKTYAVSTAEGLVAMSNIAIKGGESVVLTADIDLAGVEFNGLNAFNPENNNTFDGNGHTVSNWIYTGKADDMGFIKNWVGPIRNLTIKNAVLRTGGRSAIIAAKPYGNIENCHVEDCNLQASYWACGLITGMHNSGNMDNCTAKNSYIKSTGGTGAITGVLNETAGERKYSNCKVEGCTINNEGDDPYAGAAIVGLINIDNATVKFEACTLSDNTYKGTAKNDIYGYNAGDNTTVTVE